MNFEGFMEASWQENAAKIDQNSIQKGIKKNDGKKEIRSHPRLFFFDLATLTIVRILRYESHLSCFCSYQVFH